MPDINPHEPHEIIEYVNEYLEECWQEDNPLPIEIHGKPQLHIIRFEPLVYERYGRLRNRAPYVSGNVALRALLTSRSSNRGGVQITLGVQEGNLGLGFNLDGHIPQHRGTFAKILFAAGVDADVMHIA